MMESGETLILENRMEPSDLRSGVAAARQSAQSQSGLGSNMTVTVSENLLTRETIIRGPRNILVRLTPEDLEALDSDSLRYLFRNGYLLSEPAIGLAQASTELRSKISQLLEIGETVRDAMADEMLEKATAADRAAQELLDQPTLPGMSSITAPDLYPISDQGTPQNREPDLLDQFDPGIKASIELGEKAKGITSDALDALTQALEYLSVGDAESALNCLATLNEADADAALAIINTMLQIVGAVGIQHQLSRLAQLEARRARMRKALIETGSASKASRVR